MANYESVEVRQGKYKARLDYSQTGEFMNPYPKETERYKGYQVERHNIYMEELRADPDYEE